MVQKVNDSTYKVSPREFSKRIKSLAQLIDIFELTTVYQQGASVGCRIGAIQADSLAQELGFAAGDIITSIDDIPVTDAQNRFKLYKQIVDLQTNSAIKVHLLRNKQEMVLTVVLMTLKRQNLQMPKTNSSLMPLKAQHQNN